MDRLANGTNPFSDSELPDDSILNDVRLSRCFFYVSDLLRQAIENGGAVNPAKRPKRAAFHLSDEAKRTFPFLNQPRRISEFVARMNGLIDAGAMKKITAAVITGWLLDKGFLALEEYSDGRKTRQPTAQGEYIGLSTEIRSGQYGSCRAVLYSEDAQRFVLDNLDAILKA